MIAPRARGRLRGSLRPRLSWTRAGICPSATTGLVGTRGNYSKLKLQFKVKVVFPTTHTDLQGGMQRVRPLSRTREGASGEPGGM